MRQGDLDSYDDALKGIMDHNAKHPLSAITPESIKRSLKRHMETSKNIAANKGISISPQNQDIINLREMESMILIITLNLCLVIGKRVTTRRWSHKEKESDKHNLSPHIYHQKFSKCEHLICCSLHAHASTSQPLFLLYFYLSYSFLSIYTWDKYRGTCHHVVPIYYNANPIWVQIIRL